MTTMQGIEQTTTNVTPEGAQTSEGSVVRSQLWKENAEKFLKGEPKVLGVVQIMIALINLSLGMIMMNTTPIRFPPLSVYTWAPVWGPIMFLLSGSLSIAAAVRTTESLVTSSLSLNTISSVVAAATSIISVFSVTIDAFEKFGEIFVGIDALMLILNMLEFCIAVSISAFGCKASCCSSIEVVVILPPNPAESAPVPPMLLRPLVPPVYQEKNVPENLCQNPTGERFQF
ncbi:membrane-spanning 4-domains subfamily A member 4D [Mesocricetus auratus]|uniref:Membrane-spanning 4-domains subfamily A member 4D n=1 Tax=Mesocricetus auratus TaxID=10036 RepID=A0A3Q0CLG1_MESAU|nr:membrane-spanning 4-domains subfamily A member 4D [Mesocricetus auratus]